MAGSGNVKIAMESRPRGVAVARVTGRLDFSSSTAARDQFAQALTAGNRYLIIDLSKVEFVDSAGLGTLIGGMRRARQAGGDLSIANPNDQVSMLLSLTSLDKVLKVHRTVEEAVLAVA